VTKEVELAVVVVIEKSRSRGEARIAYSGFLCNVSERAIAVVFEQVIGTDTCDIEIIKTVVIEVADRTSHSPTNITHSCFVRDIGKRSITVIAV
jgi:hypothetical protein